MKLTLADAPGTFGLHAPMDALEARFVWVQPEILSDGFAGAYDRGA